MVVLHFHRWWVGEIASGKRKRAEDRENERVIDGNKNAGTAVATTAAAATSTTNEWFNQLELQVKSVSETVRQQKPKRMLVCQKLYGKKSIKISH